MIPQTLNPFELREIKTLNPLHFQLDLRLRTPSYVRCWMLARRPLNPSSSACGGRAAPARRLSHGAQTHASLRYCNTVRKWLSLTALL